MKKIRSKLSLVLLMILSFVFMVSAAVSIIVRADSAYVAGEPAQLQSDSESWYDISYDDNSLTILLDAGVCNYSGLSKSDLDDIKNKLFSAFRKLVIDKLVSTNTYAAGEMSSVDIPMVLADDDSDSSGILSGNIFGKYESLIISRLKSVDENGVRELDKYLSGGYDSVIKYAISEYIEEHKDELFNGNNVVEDIIREIVDQVQKVVADIINEIAEEENWPQYRKDDYIQQNDDRSNIVEEIAVEVAEIIENGGSVSLSVMELLSMIREFSVNDIVIFSNGYFQVSGLRQLISILPRPSDIANRSDADMKFDFDVCIDTTVGKTEFQVKVGFKGDCSTIRSAAQFIADHMEVSKENGIYNVNIVSDEVSALLLKLSNTSRIPDNVKLAVFGMFDKTGDEIFDKASGYNYAEILDYFKNKDFHGIFACLIDAEKIKSYFSGYNVDLSKLSNESIDNLINRIFEYAEKVAKKQNVEGVEEFLKRYGVPAQFEEAVQKFMNLLSKIDYEYWNAETVRTFLNDKTAFNAKIDAGIQKLANSETTRKLYDKFVNYAERAFNRLPDQFHNGTILGLYEGNGELAWSGSLDFDVKEILTQVINKLVPYAENAGYESAGEYADRISGLIDTWFYGDMSFNVNLSLNMSLPGIYKVEYVVNDEKIAAGLLPAGADVEFYANIQEVDGNKIIGWVDDEGEFYTKMPEKDITLYAVTEFEVVLTIDEEEVPEVPELVEKTYDGESINLTATVKGSVGNYIYKWYKDDNLLEDATEAVLNLVNVKDSGKYYCEVSYITSNGQEVSAVSQTVEIKINKAVIDFSEGSWVSNDTEGYYVYNGDVKTVGFELGFELPDEIKYELVKYSATDAGTYYAYIKVTYDEANYEVINPYSGEDNEHCYEWSIAKAKVTVTDVKLVEKGKTELGSYVYDGTTIEVEIIYTSNYKEVLEIVEDEDSENYVLIATDAGTYKVYFTFAIKEEYAANYEFEEVPGDFTEEWSIAKAKVTVTDVKLVEKGKTTLGSYVYNGTEIEVEVIYSSNDKEKLELVADETEGNYVVKTSEAGTHKVYFTFAIKEEYAANYEFEEVPGDFTEEWSIAKAKVTVTDVKLVEKGKTTLGSYVYNGTEIEVEVIYNSDNKDLTAIVEDKTSGNYVVKTANAGTHKVYFTIKIKAEYQNNYELAGELEPYQFTWTIAKATLDFSNSDWNYTEGMFTYDGDEHSVDFIIKEANGKTIPENFVTKTFSGIRTATNAGNYTTTVTIKYADQSNYEIISPVASNTLNWKIAQYEINISNSAWNYSEPFVYDGVTLHTVRLENVPDTLYQNADIYLKYINAEAIDVGEYVASVELDGADKNNFYLIAPGSLEWVVDKASIIIEGFEWTWTGKEYEYNSFEHNVLITNANQFEQLEVSYEGNTAIDVGIYTAIATFTVKEEYDNNYKLVGSNIVTYEWSIKEYVAPQETYKEKTIELEDGTTITVGGEVSEKVLETLVVTDKTNEYTDEQFNPWVKEGTLAKIVKVYGISMALPEDFSGTITVKITNESFADIDPITVHIPNGTTEISKDTCGDYLETSLDGTNVTFETSSFSDFVIVNQVPEEKQNLWWVWLIVALIIILTILIIVLIILLVCKKDDDEPEAVEEEPSVVIVNTNEEVIEEVNEEEPEAIEDTVTEPEPVPELEVIEESDSEPIVEEVAQEESVEEIPDETVVVEAPVVEPAPESVVVAPVMVVGSEERTVYDKSFTARLSQADTTIKAYYSELKNYILSYNGVKSRISWHFDSFNKGREKCIKLQIRGKSMYMYIALNPADVEEKYRANDVSDKARYVAVPTMVRIRKPRSLKYAKQLVAKLMENMGVELGKVQNKQYRVAYKSTEALIQAGLIKIKVTKNNFINTITQSDTDTDNKNN